MFLQSHLCIKMFPYNFISVYLYLPSNASISWAAKDFFTFFSRGLGLQIGPLLGVLIVTVVIVSSFLLILVIVLDLQGSLNYLFVGDQTMRMSGNFEGFPLE